MGTIVDTLPTLGQPNATEDGDVRTQLASLLTEINGLLDDANIAAGAVTDGKLASPGVGIWQPIYSVNGPLIPALAGGTYGFNENGPFSLSANGYRGYLWHPASVPLTLGDKTAKIRLVQAQACNATSSGVNVSAELRPITGFAGAGSGALQLTVGAPVCAVGFIPGASTLARIEGPEVAVSTLGAFTYILCVTTSGSLAANSVATLHIDLERRYAT